MELNLKKEVEILKTDLEHEIMCYEPGAENGDKYDKGYSEALGNVIKKLNTILK